LTKKEVLENAVLRDDAAYADETRGLLVLTRRENREDDASFMFRCCCVN
jgi:hypothetical protein